MTVARSIPRAAPHTQTQTHTQTDTHRERGGGGMRAAEATGTAIRVY